MLTSTQIRQSFLDFFREKQHTIVPSSSLLPDSPNLLFTNAGMNQFVPIFLGEKKADVSKWGGAIPGSDTRAADTQKCIRAGGKHNDLDDVGLDTYHHTFFEMLGNWSFGDYFKKEAIEWAWELVVGRWKFPANRVYATVYCPYMGKANWETRWIGEMSAVRAMVRGGGLGYVIETDDREYVKPDGDAGLDDYSDQQAMFFWMELFMDAQVDDRIHIVPGNKKDNFWMMGETGPCGPCSELHIDLTPAGDTRGALVNKGTAECIEIWNLVFIQFNANPDGSFSPLPAQHVDTGMGFERVTSIIQGTRDFTDFANAKISNYETDIFRPIFDELEKLSGKRYTSTLPLFPGSALVPSASEGVPPSRTSPDVSSPSDSPSASGALESSFRRDAASASLSAGSTSTRDGCAPRSSDPAQIQIDVAFRVIADHIRTLSFAIADGIQPGNTDRNYVLRRILRRAVRYGRTLGFTEPFFYKLAAVLARTMGDVFPEIRAKQKHVEEVLKREEEAFNKTLDKGIEIFEGAVRMNRIAKEHGADPDSITWYESIKAIDHRGTVFGEFAFTLYDTYGFPLDLTELMAREHGLTVDTAGFEKHMEEQRARARAAQKKQVIELSEIETKTPTHFIGYDHDHTGADVQEVLSVKGKTAVIANNSVCYAEMGGQVGDTGEMTGHGGNAWRIANTQKSGNTWLHFLEETDGPAVGEHVTIQLDQARRGAIQRHHTVTHLLHWALHEVVSKEATQKGSFVGPDKLTFDFNSAALTPAQVRDIERLVNERIVENTGVSWIEVPYTDVRGRGDIMQFFGDKYGETVRVVQIGGHAAQLDGYSMELCAGTHTRATGQIGLFRINAESAIAAGVRRIEAVAGLNAYDLANADTQRLHALATRMGTPLPELEKRIDGLLAQQKELEKALKAAQQREAAGRAKDLLASAANINGTPAIIANLGAADGDTLQTVADALKSHGFKGVTVLGGTASGAVALVAAVSPDFTAKVQAGKIIQAIAPIVGGKGGGKPEGARGGGKDPSKLDDALAQAKTLLG